MAVLGAQVGDSQERFALKGASPTCCQLLRVRQCLPQKYVPTLPPPKLTGMLACKSLCICDYDKNLKALTQGHRKERMEERKVEKDGEQIMKEGTGAGGH